MAVWIYAYGKNGLMLDEKSQSQEILNILNNIELNPLKMLDTIKPHFFTRQYYTENRKSLEENLKSMTEEEYVGYLDSLGLPFIDTNNIINHFIEEGEKRESENEIKYNSAYNKYKIDGTKPNWEFNGKGSFINKLGFFDNNYDGLRFVLINDLIWLTGPSGTFSKYFYFLQDLAPEYREYYHTYFKNILKAFKSDFILYAHEWSGLDDEDNENFNFKELKESADWANTSSKTLSEMNTFYHETIR